MSTWQCTLCRRTAPTVNIAARTFTCQAEDLVDLADTKTDLSHIKNMQPGDVFYDTAGDRWKRLT